jgi:hypothetical protein
MDAYGLGGLGSLCSSFRAASVPELAESEAVTVHPAWLDPAFWAKIRYWVSIGYSPHRNDLPPLSRDAYPYRPDK